MIFDLFNIIFFLILIILKWILPRSLLAPCFLLLGILFIFKYSLVCLLLWVGVTLIIISYYVFMEWWKRLTAFLLTALLILGAQKIGLNLEPKFSFEIMLLFIYNMSRAWSLYRSFPAMPFFSPKVSDVVCYLWFPPLLFSGPLERFGEFRRLHYSSNKVSIFNVTWYLSSAIGNGLIALILLKAFDPILFDFNKAELPLLSLYMVQSSLLIVFQFISWIHFVRAVCHLMGYNFSKPNFQNFLSSGGLLQFWINWNMSFTRFIRDYVFFPLNRIPSMKEILIRIIMAFSFYGPMHGVSPAFFLWGLLQGVALLVQSFYRISSRRLRFIRIIDQFFLKIFKNGLTLGWLALTTPLLLPEGPVLYQQIYIKILESLKNYSTSISQLDDFKLRFLELLNSVLESQFKFLS